MPHLSPLKWLLMFIILWVLMMTLSTTMWWTQHPTWPLLPKQNKTKSTLLSWKWF